MLRDDAPAVLEVPELGAIGTFRVAGESERTPRWSRNKRRTPAGEFVSVREIQLSNPIAGLTGSHRYSHAFGNIGIADVEDADTSREALFGAGPAVVTTDLTATARSSAVASMTMSNDAAVGANAWGTPTNAAASDDARTSVSTEGQTNYLKGLNPGFTLGVGAVVKGIKLRIEKRLVVTSTTDGPNSGGTFANESSVGTQDWTNPGNAVASDGSDATNAASGAQLTTRYLKATNFGFSVPTDSEIVGVDASIERAASAGSASTGADLAGAGENKATFGATAWADVGNITAADNVRATATGGSGGSLSNYLRAKTFGFAIPAGAAILGVEATVNRSVVKGSGNTGHAGGGTFASDNGVGTAAWQNPGNAAVNDGSYATAGALGSEISEYLKVTNLGLGVPTSSTIVGVEGVVHRRVSGLTPVDSTDEDDAAVTGSSETRSGASAGWNSASNIQTASDAGYAQVTLGVNGAYSNWLQAVNFDGISLPAGAEITGVEFVFRFAENGVAADAWRVGQARIVKGGVIGDTNFATVPNACAGQVSTFTDKTIGGPGELAGWALTKADVEGTGFGVAFSANIGEAGEGSIYFRVSQVSCKIYYQILNNVTDDAPSVADNAARSGSAQGWIDNDNIKTASDAAASDSDGNNDQSDFLTAEDFDLSAIPDAAVITGVRMTVRAKLETGTPGLVEWAIIEAGVVSAESGNILRSVTSSFADYSYGGAGETLGLTLTGADVKVTGFGVGVAAIFSGSARIAVSQIEIEVWYTNPGATDETVRLVKGGTVSGDNKADTATAWPAAEASKSYGGAAAMWGLGLTPANVNASNFGLVISVDLDDNAQGEIDYVTVKVYYTTSVDDERVRIVKSDGSIGTEDKASGSEWPSTEATTTYGSASDDWGEAWAPADINDGDFGLVVAADMGEGALARVDWIRLEVTYLQDGVVDSSVRLVVAGAITGDDKALAGAWPDADASQTYGGAADLWGTTPTVANVNATTFGIVLSATVEDGVTAEVDHITMGVTFITKVDDTIVRLVKGGTVVGDNKASGTTWVTDEAYVEYGGINDLWGETWIDTDVEGATFGAVLSATLVGDGAANVDHMEITVYWDEDGEPKQVTKIFAAGPDANGQDSRYIHAMAGSNVHIIDPTDDLEKHVETFANTIVAGDASKWAGVWWLAFAGIANDDAEYISTVWNGVTMATTTCDFEATHFEAGPDALYRSYNDFGSPANLSKVKKCDLADPATVKLNTNWAPTNGEQMGDPGTPVTRLTTLGERLVVGKQDGVGELDADYTFRSYLRWMQPFTWEYNANGILPLGQGGDFLMTHRRGLFALPVNQSIGIEQLTNNDTAKQGRYTALAFDGQWVYAALFNPSASDPTTGTSFIMKMRRRRTAGPGAWEHHPIATLENTVILDFFLWPGAVVSGVVYGPRLYFGAGVSKVGYFKLDELTYTDEWTVEWPEDAFGSPKTRKRPYKIEANYRGVADTEGITFEYRTHDPHEGGVETEHTGEHWHPFTDDGSDQGTPAVLEEGFHQRFARREQAEYGRHIGIRAKGAGGGSSIQQRIAGDVTFSYLDQPETVQEITTLLECAYHEGVNDAEAADQYRALEELQGRMVTLMIRWGDANEDEEEVEAFIRDVSTEHNVSSDQASGIILATVVFDVLDFIDEFDPAFAN